MDKETKESAIKMMERYKRWSTTELIHDEKKEAYMLVTLDLQELIKDSEKRGNCG